MGYRSDIRIRMKKGGYKIFKEQVEKESKNYVEKLKLNNNNEKYDLEYDYNLLNSVDIFKETETDIYFGWNYLKWYEGQYKDVDIIMESLEELNDEGYSYSYARIGEDYSDIEENYVDNNEDGDYLECVNIIRTFDDEV